MSLAPKVTRAFAHINPAWGFEDVQIYLVSRMVIDGVTQRPYYPVVNWVQAKPIEEGMDRAPAFRLDKEVAQELMEGLWACGVRPRDTGSVGQLAAVESHLKDFRTIAFHALKIPTQ